MKHWIFDLDGTLADSLTIHFQVLQRIFSGFGLDFSKEDQQDILRISSRDFPKYLETKLGTQDGSQAYQLYQKFNQETLKDVQCFPGIVDLLQTLKTQGAQLAIWTARDFEATQEILKHTGLGIHFSICVTGSCVSQGKPNPEGLVKIADHFGCEPESMVMVGDFDSDMLGAKAFGIKA
ncbi:MAG: hypothetical protein COT73_11245, partial [Bdellovibrio sp. CG10_big_fil_rev_8_21_14_0_10_47_8]